MLLIDAFNVVRAQWVLPPERRGLDVHGLIALIGRSRFAGRRLRVVVDGRPSPAWLRHGVYDTLAGHAWTRVGRAEVVFSGRGAEADDVIEEILARTEGVAITVVSSDRRLVMAAGRAGADQIGNGSFLRLLNEDLDREAVARVPAFAAEVPLDRYSVAHWMREFGYAPPAEPERVVTPPPPPVKKARPPEKAPAAEGFGTRLRVDLGPVGAPAGGGTGEKAGGVGGVAGPAGVPGAAGDGDEPLDPMLRDAFEEWYGALHLGDLDMRKWVDGIEPV